jgi:peptidoglycan hydrolase-like protein with peptidoglycan-binding domain
VNRRIFIAAGAVAAVGGAAAAAWGFGGGSTGTPRRTPQPPKTADITKVTLTDYEEVAGQLGFGATVPLRSSGEQGLVTWLPPVGSTVDRGKPLFKVNNEPVVLLFGELPLYRPLTVEVKGPDVKQLEENLRALGYSGLTADETFTAATATAVKKWQKDLGLTETGTVAPGQVLYAGGAIRVAAQTARVGDVANGEILSYTGTVRNVLVDLQVTQQHFAPIGGTVQITLPDSKLVQGKVESVGTVASTASSSGAQEGGGGSAPATVQVTVSVTDQAALGTLQQGPVRVRFVAEERTDVLSVPVTALLALAEGGYGIQLVEGSATRYVAVETGMFANGRVEIRGSGLQVGMKVSVPK